jgi:soluble lytic murein transglycosylase-like protein
VKLYDALASKNKWDPKLVEKVWKEAVKQNFNPILALAVVGHESNFKAKVKGKPNKDGSVDFGLFQLNSRYHPQFKSDLDAHVSYGVKFLKQTVERYGLEKGLGVYNAGASPASEGKRKAYLARVMPYIKSLYAIMPEVQLSILETRRQS